MISNRFFFWVQVTVSADYTPSPQLHTDFASLACKLDMACIHLCFRKLFIYLFIFMILIDGKSVVKLYLVSMITLASS